MHLRHYSLIVVLAFIGGAIGDLLAHHLLSSQGLLNPFRPKYLSAGKGFFVIDIQGQTWVELTKYDLTFRGEDPRYQSLGPHGLHLHNREASRAVALSPSEPCLLCFRQYPGLEESEMPTIFMTTIGRCDNPWQLAPAEFPKFACSEDETGIVWQIP